MAIALVFFWLECSHGDSAEVEEKYSTLYYPDVRNKTWSAVKPTHIKCPNRDNLYDSSEDTIVSHVTVSLPDYKADYHIPGFLCHKITYTTSCTEGILWSQTISQKIQGAKISHLECVESIKEYLSGTLVSFGFPLKRCEWRTIVDESQNEIVVEPHKVLVDPYNGRYVDPIFPGGYTSPGPTQTIHSDVIWVPEQVTLSDLCTTMRSQQGIVYNKGLQSERNNVTVFGTVGILGGREFPLKGSCRMKYCNKTGIRVASGEWIDVSVNLNAPANQPKFLEGISACSGSEVISLSQSSGLTDESSGVALDTIYRLQCQQTVSKIMSNEPISQYDVSFLAQTNPGVGPVYWLNGNQLLQTMGLYQKIVSDPSEISLNIIGRLPNGEPLIETNIFSDKQFPTVKRLPNGFMIVNNKLIQPPGLILENEIHSWLIRPADLHPINHPISQIIDNMTSLLPSAILPRYNYTDIPLVEWDSFFPEWLSWKPYVLLICLIILLFICLKTFRLCLKKCISNSSKLDPLTRVVTGSGIPLLQLRADPSTGPTELVRYQPTSNERVWRGQEVRSLDSINF